MASPVAWWQQVTGDGLTEVKRVIELEISPLSAWGGANGRPLVIAGPCSAETEAQLFETARQLSERGVDYLRAGLWKARTRPSSFAGIGDEALIWLKEAGAEHDLRTATEVAKPDHVEKALEVGIGAVWIGARTTANPFSVQELASALRGTDIPVMIKNPTNPDLGLWIGAIERISGANVRNLAAIHRGFSTANRTRFRNKPMWNLVIELRRLIPNLPILTDPSHIAGRRDLIYGIAQRAMDLGLDGLMVESRPSPDEAWSDSAQQITPQRLAEILGRLIIRRESSDDLQFNASLEDLRQEIDQIDDEILEVLSLRMGIVERIAESKKASNVTTLQLRRWMAILEDRTRKGRELGLAPEYVKAVYEVIHQESIRRQSRLMGDREHGQQATG